MILNNSKEMYYTKSQENVVFYHPLFSSFPSHPILSSPAKTTYAISSPIICNNLSIPSLSETY